MTTARLACEHSWWLSDPTHCRSSTLTASAAPAQKLLPEQGLLENVERWQSVLCFFGDDDVATRLDARWAAQASGARSSDINATRWAELEAEVSKVARVRSPTAVYVRRFTCSQTAHKSAALQGLQTGLMFEPAI